MRWKRMLSAGLALAVLLGLMAVAQDVTLTTWEMPFADAYPAGLALGGDGTVFVAESGGMEVYRLDPVSSIFRSWGVGEGPEDVTVTEGVPFCSVGDGNLVVYFDPDGLSTNSARIPFPDVKPGEIHRGPDLADGRWSFWMTERGVSTVGIVQYLYNPTFDAPIATGDPSDRAATPTAVEVTPVTVTAEHVQFSYDVSLIPAPEPASGKTVSSGFTEWRFDYGDFVTQDLAVAADGTLWISFGNPFLLRFDPVAETIQLLETIQNVSIFQGLLPDPDGSIWFGNLIDGSIGHLHPGTGLSEVWRIPGNIEVYDMAFDASGAIWYTDRVGEAIGHFDPATGEATIYPLPAGSEPLYLAIDDTGAVWFTAGSGNYIGRLVIGASADVSF